MTDDVLSVKYSPNGKLLAVSLLDSTVKVFYQDSLKFFLSLYGHKVCGWDLLHMVAHLKSSASCSIDGHVSRFEANCYMFRGQEREDLGP